MSKGQHSLFIKKLGYLARKITSSSLTMHNYELCKWTTRIKKLEATADGEKMNRNWYSKTNDTLLRFSEFIVFPRKSTGKKLSCLYIKYLYFI